MAIKVFGFEFGDRTATQDRGSLGLTMGQLVGRDGDRAFGLDTPEARAFFTAQESGSSDVKLLSKEEAFSRITWVHKCVTKNAEMIAALPFVVKRGETVVENHDLLRLIRNPNPYFTEADLWYMTISTLNLYGEVFWLLNRESYDGLKRAPDPRGVLAYPKSVWTVHPKQVSAILSSDKRTLLAWRVTLPGSLQQDIDPIDVIHFRFPNPFNPWRGSSPLDSASLAVSADYSAQLYNLGVFARGAIPSGVLVAEGKLNPATAAEIVSKFEARHRESHRPAILHSGLDYRETQMSNHDMEFKELRKMNREDILAAFGVPPVAVGLLEHASYANADMQNKLYWEGTLIPQADLIANSVRKQLMRNEPDNMSCMFDRSGVAILQDDVGKKLEAATKLMNLSYTPNQINERLGLGMPNNEWGDTAFLPFGLTPIEFILDPPEPEPLVPPDDEEEPDTETEDENEDEPAEITNGFSWGRLATKIDRISARDQILKSIVSGKPVPVPAITSGADINSRIESVAHRVVLAQRADSTSKKLNKILSIIEKDKKSLKKLAEMYLRQAASAGIGQINDLLGTGFDITNPKVVEFLEGKVSMITQIDDYTKEWIKDTINDALANGLDVNEIADIIREDYNLGPDRAYRIARTETASATNGARFITMSEEGITEHEWLTSRGPNVRDSHQAEEGSVVKIGEEFPVTMLLFPGDPEGEPEEIVNCQCITLPVESERKIQINRDAYWHQVFGQRSVGEALTRRFGRAMSRHFNNQRRAILKILLN